MNLNDRIQQFPLMDFTAFYELPWVPAVDIPDGAILVETADLTNPFGRTIYKAGLADMLEKKVPYAVQHTAMKTTQHGAPHRLEASWFITERLLLDTDAPCVIVCHRKANTDQINRAIAFGRLKLNQPYGLQQVMIKGLNLFYPWAKLPGNDNAPPFCSFLNADQWDHGGIPLFGEGDEDHKVAPWDYLTERAMERVYIFGRGGRREPVAHS